MGFGVGFRVADGLRLRVTPHGPRVSLGPRIARVHVGGGRSAVSTGAGPVTLWHTLSGGGSTSRAGRRDETTKAQAWQHARTHLDRLLHAHEDQWELATHPFVATPSPVDPDEVRRELRREAAHGLPWWRLRARWRARQDADVRTDEVVASRQAELDVAHASSQAAADRWWRALCDNDPDTVADRLDRAFEDNVLTAAVAAVEGDTVHVVVTADRPEVLVGEREPTLTEKGNLSLARMTKTRRNELYGQAVVATMLAVACEAFAVAPGLQHAEVAVLRPDADEGPAVIALSEFERDQVLVTDGTTARVRRPASAVLEQALVITRPGGRTGALRPLPPEEDEDIAMLLDTIELAD